MASETSHSLQQVEAKQTTVGNYFVANYPPFSFWTPERVSDAFAVFEQMPQPGTDLGLYLHIPFCRKRCHFCYFRVYTDKNAAQIRHYMKAVLRELDLYANRPFVGGRDLRFVYFGGGTPSYLSAEQLRYLFEGMKERLAWDRVEEVTFECEPGTLNEKKLRALKDLGVTRLSLGIENFNQQILEINGRAHGAKEIDQAYNSAREVGFDQINIDLIAGMVNETPENWARCVARAIELEPECITIYQMEVPYNTTLYQRMQQEGLVTAPVADWTTKRQWVGDAFRELEKAGYTVGSAYTAVRTPQKTRFVYRDQLWSGADLLGVGVASFGLINGVHYQNQHNWAPYLDKLDRGELPIHRALAMTDDEKCIREFILQMKLGSVRRHYFLDKFGVDIGTRFGAALSDLQARGYAYVDESGVTLSRESLLRVDTLLPAFFLPEHQDVRYA